MPNWKRITLVVFVLVGGTIIFGYWSRYQFNNALSDLETTLTANTVLVSSSLEKDTKLASASPEISEKLASSSKETMPVVTTSTASLSASSSDLGPSFNFPKKGDEVYTRCTYTISWQSSAAINSLGIALIDAGARKSVDPVASGLAKENMIKKDSQSLKWKIGIVWPGKYYIKVLKINGADVEIRSNVFTINNMPTGINTDEREKICKKSGGLF